MRILDFLKDEIIAKIKLSDNHPLKNTNKNYKKNLALLLFVLFILIFSIFGINTIMVIIGIAFVFAGFNIKNYTQSIEKNGIRVKAKIVDFEIVEKRETRQEVDQIITYHYPIVAFKDLNGNTTTQKTDSSTSSKEINDVIDIVYLKNGNEYQVMIDSNWRKSYFPICFIVIGFYLFLNGLLSIINTFIN